MLGIRRHQLPRRPSGSNGSRRPPGPPRKAPGALERARTLGVLGRARTLGVLERAPTQVGVLGRARHHGMPERARILGALETAPLRGTPEMALNPGTQDRVQSSGMRARAPIRGAVERARHHGTPGRARMPGGALDRALTGALGPRARRAGARRARQPGIPPRTGPGLRSPGRRRKADPRNPLQIDRGDGGKTYCQTMVPSWCARKIGIQFTKTGFKLARHFQMRNCFLVRFSVLLRCSMRALAPFAIHLGCGARQDWSQANGAGTVRPAAWISRVWQVPRAKVKIKCRPWDLF